jgi:hypothetical protein
MKRAPAEVLKWWHWAAKEAMRMAVKMGAAIELRRGEVCKGAPPTARLDLVPRLPQLGWNFPCRLGGRCG